MTFIWEYRTDPLTRRNMPRKDALDPDRDSNQPSNGLGGLAPSASSPSPSHYSSAYGSVSQQYPFVDPGVLAMTNTAATIAAVAASALQHITQAKPPPLPNNAVSASVNPGLGGRKPLLPSHRGHAGASPHFTAALLGSSVPGAAPVSFSKHAASSIHAGIHRALSPADASSSLHHSTANSISSALLPHMQSWPPEQLGENEPLIYVAFQALQP
jgi:hypothetical protein